MATKKARRYQIGDTVRVSIGGRRQETCKITSNNKVGGKTVYVVREPSGQEWAVPAKYMRLVSRR